MTGILIKRMPCEGTDTHMMRMPYKNEDKNWGHVLISQEMLVSWLPLKMEAIKVTSITMGTEIFLYKHLAPVHLSISTNHPKLLPSLTF